MKEFNILTPGEKIKNIRNRFEIRQEDITGGDITRNLISIIENNKANLTEPVAKILVYNINNICKERNIDFSITEEYLLEDVVSQAKKIADEYIEEINALKENEITTVKEKLFEIDVFLKKYKTEDKKALLYRDIGKKFLEIKQYSRAFEYFLKAYESSVNKGATTNALIKLGICSMYLSKYDDAINYYNLLLDLNDDPNMQYVAKFNLAICNKKLEKFDDAINLLNDIVENHENILSNSLQEYIETNVLMATCLYKMKSFNKSIALYKELLKKVDSEKDEVFILANLADVYREIKDYAKLEKVCEKIKNKIKDDIHFMNLYECTVYTYLSRNLIAINDREGAKDLLLKAIEAFKTGTSTIYLEDIEKVFIDLLNMLMEDDDEEAIEYLKNEFFELIQKEMFPRGSITALKFIKYYNEKNNKAEVSNIIAFLEDR